MRSCRKFSPYLPASVVIVFGLGLCISSAGEEDPKPKVSLEERIAQLEGEVDALTQLFTKLMESWSKLLTTSGTRSLSLAPLDCATHKYAEAKVTEGGLFLLVACEDIEKFLEGHRIRLRIGNPYAVTFQGVTGTLWHGPSLAEGVLSSGKTELSSADPVRPGYWNTVLVVVNPSKPEQMRELAVSLAVDEAVLMKDLK